MDESNLPIVSSELKTQIEQLQEWTENGIVVANTTDHIAVYDAIRAVKNRKSQVIEFYKSIKQSARAAWQVVVDKEKSYTDILDNFEIAAKEAIRKFEYDQEVKRLQEQRRLQIVADEKARKERERLEKEATKLKTPEKREERLAAAAAVVAPVIEVAPKFDALKGQSNRKIWRARVVDAAIVPREWLIPDEKGLASFATATKGAKQIPGVEFYFETSMAVRKGS